MICAIYKSNKKQGMYLYITKKDDFSPVPEQLMQMFGKPTMVMVVNLAKRGLATVDVDKVKESLLSDGFFLQLPPPVENELDTYKRRKKEQGDATD
ncbi:YcgL domain-containing protein [Vibrio inusitatus NBRC 102082]|uniref:YcgL domain-containing protein VIN01S_03140 n=1 Tax=Vibrio inusitatus NBRC 102082 TaxID=1219070 RepID=A0A4Y3HRV1_9VIBR|nr:YcgL domain-containing protein [Vibrio inusitatus]GEA49510.1 YcgL domain-containing protein [Vibrio inusitatus NBRC 102082]